MTPIAEEHKRAALAELIEGENYEMAMRYLESWDLSSLAQMTNTFELMLDMASNEMRKRAR